MTVTQIPVRPFAGQKPGTSGLRKKTSEFRQPGYLEAYLQALFDALPELKGGRLALGGDGRFFNREAIQIILRMAAANGVAEVLVGRDGILSTPAASHVIRKHGCTGGIILSASHNPGGPDGDFGVKYNIGNGGPAPEKVTDAIYRRTAEISHYAIAESGPLDLSREGEALIGACRIQVIDPVADYAALMEQLFDFDLMRDWIRRQPRAILFDAMHAVTGPYATAILGKLGAPASAIMNAVPLPDFGAGHPDPNPVHAEALMHALFAADAPALGAASDGDGDRNMIVGAGFYVTPSDSLAVLAANATLVPGYAKGIAGIARSMPTSRAADQVAAALNVPAFETPTGWKYFGNLLDAGRATLCGEESFGTGSDHVREKDGLWAVLFWLNILARRNESVASIVRDHWRRYGRHFYSRHDYEAIPLATGDDLIADLRGRVAGLAGRRVGSLNVETADDFSYTDPIDGSISTKQGVRVMFANGARLVMRLSGTGTEGATLRVYLETYEPDASRHGADTADVLRPVAEAAELIAGIARRTGRAAPDVVT